MKAELLFLFPWLATPYGKALVSVIFLVSAILLIRKAFEVRDLMRRSKWMEERKNARLYYAQAEKEWERRHFLDKEKM